MPEHNAECIEWPRGRSDSGYGVVRFGGKDVKVHRLAYRMFHDLDEPDMPRVVMHTCDNPACYNVDHLVGGTQAENLRDCVMKGRNNIDGLKANHVERRNRTHCANGHPRKAGGGGCRKCNTERMRRVRRGGT